MKSFRALNLSSILVWVAVIILNVSLAIAQEIPQIPFKTQGDLWKIIKYDYGSNAAWVAADYFYP